MLSALATETLSSALLVLRGKEDVAEIEDVLVAILREIFRQFGIHGEVLLLKLSPIMFSALPVLRLDITAESVDPTEDAGAIPAAAGTEEALDPLAIFRDTVGVPLL